MGFRGVTLKATIGVLGPGAVGGVKQSGTGWREAGIEALDVYTDWKYVNLIADPAKT